MNKNIEELRRSLIVEAQNSPMLLSDLAGLEAYVSESYNCRSFIELLQNADDAGANSFFVKRVKDYIVVANNGRLFSINDLESLCRSASSNKVRGTTIGYRGIGFKSVVSFAKEVHLVSGEFKITFSKELSKQEVPQAQKVPLIRIPHPLKESVKRELANEIDKIQGEGYHTIFVFSGVAANQIDEEYTTFASTTLLFLNNIRSIRIQLTKKVSANISVIEDNDWYRKLKVTTTDLISDWYVYSENNCSIAFSLDKDEIERLTKTQAAIHAFLPTEDSCGLGVVVNGDFSTDPSRRHLILDKTTNHVISNLAHLYTSLLRYALENNRSNMVNALMPYYDISLIQLMKQSFEKELTKQIKIELGSYFSKIRLAPSWFNAGDYSKIMSEANQPHIAPECSEVSGLNGMLKFLGSKNDDIENIISYVKSTEISVLGYAQVAVAGINSVLMNHQLDALLTVPLFISDNNLCSLQEINNKKHTIDDSFIELMLDEGISTKDIELCLKKLGLKDLQKCQFTEEKSAHTHSEGTVNAQGNVTDWFNDTSSTPVKVSSAGIQKWRSAEENARNALNANGFSLRDVSNQNVGYDLEGKDPNGSEIYIEVKSVDFAGQKFRMTNNEFAAAQYKQNSYFIAIVHQKANSLEISLVKNPIKNLNMTRQCVQWVWECSDYEFKPITFKF